MAFLVTGISTILALVARSVQQEVAAEGAQHELVELFLHKLVSVHLVNFTLALSHGSLTTQATKWCI